MTATIAHLSGLRISGRCRSSISLHQSRKGQFKFAKISQLPVQRVFHIQRHIKCSVSGRYSHRSLSSDGGLEEDPFWLSMVKDVACGLRNLAIFLAEQPSQLKYIEWPTFQNTLRTATLTLILVALLIIALSSIDATLCYLLAFLLRRTA